MKHKKVLWPLVLAMRSTLQKRSLGPGGDPFGLTLLRMVGAVPGGGLAEVDGSCKTVVNQ